MVTAIMTMPSLSGGQAALGLRFHPAQIAGRGSRGTLSSTLTSIFAFLPRVTFVFAAAQKQKVTIFFHKGQRISFQEVTNI